MQNVEYFRHACLLLLAVICVYTDLARGKLYNWVTLGALAAGLASAYLLDTNLPGMPKHLIGAAIAAAVGAGVLLVVYLMGSLGAGDVKMMAAVGSLAPMTLAQSHNIGFVIVAMMYAALVGAAMAVCVLIWQKRLREGLRAGMRAFVTLKAKPAPGAPVTTIPYGVAIGIGAVWAWVEIML